MQQKFGLASVIKQKANTLPGAALNSSFERQVAGEVACQHVAFFPQNRLHTRYWHPDGTGQCLHSLPLILQGRLQQHEAGSGCICHQDLSGQIIEQPPPNRVASAVWAAWANALLGKLWIPCQARNKDLKVFLLLPGIRVGCKESVDMARPWAPFKRKPKGGSSLSKLGLNMWPTWCRSEQSEDRAPHPCSAAATHCPHFQLGANLVVYRHHQLCHF